jgi:hypothetical protein
VTAPLFLLACLLPHAQLAASDASTDAAVSPTPSVRFALRSQWFADEFTIRPALPGRNDVIEFTDPWGDRGGMNRCVATGFWGQPHVEVDEAERLVRITFTGGEFQLPVNRVCPTNVEDARGLIGQFGPLTPGPWQYVAGDLPAHTFTVVPEPTSGAVLLAGPLLLGLRQRRFSIASV